MSERLCIDVVTESPGWTGSLAAAESLARQAAQAVWRRLEDGTMEAELSIVLGDDALVRDLNGRYRNQDRPTNVLSFPAEDETLPGTPRLLGDVVLSHETIAREACAQDKAPADHLQHLCVHGVLHLLGYDHQNDADAAAMEALEIAILASLGVANPYADTPATLKKPA